MPGLTAIATVMGGLVLTRSIAMGIHGPAGANPGAAIYEGITTLLAVLALIRLPGTRVMTLGLRLDVAVDCRQRRSRSRSHAGRARSR